MVDAEHGDETTYRHELGHLIFDNMTPAEKAAAVKELAKASPEELSAATGRDPADKSPLTERDLHELYARLTENVLAGRENPTSPGLRGLAELTRNAVLDVSAKVKHGLGLPQSLENNPALKKSILNYAENDPTAHPFHYDNPVGRQFRERLASNPAFSSPQLNLMAGHTAQVPNEPPFGALGGMFVAPDGLAQLNGVVKDNTYAFGDKNWTLPQWYRRTVAAGKGLMTYGSGNLGYFTHNVASDNAAAALNVAAAGGSVPQYLRNLPAGYREARQGEGPNSDQLAAHSPVLSQSHFRGNLGGQSFDSGPMQAAGQWARRVDNGPKIAAFATFLRQGKTPDEAAKLVERQLNYDDQPSIVKFFGDSGVVPFSRYTYGTTKFMLAALSARPDIAYKAGAIRQVQFNSLPGSQEQLENAPDYLQGPFTFPIGFNQKTGSADFVDAAPSLPGAVFSPDDLGAPVPKSPTLSGVGQAVQTGLAQLPAVGGVAQTVMNRNRYGQPLNPPGTPDDLASVRDAVTVSSGLLPGVVTGTGQRAFDAMHGVPRAQEGGMGRTPLDRRPETGGEVLSRWAGLPVPFETPGEGLPFEVKDAVKSYRTAAIKASQNPSEWNRFAADRAKRNVDAQMFKYKNSQLGSSAYNLRGLPAANTP